VALHVVELGGRHGFGMASNMADRQIDGAQFLIPSPFIIDAGAVEQPFQCRHDQVYGSQVLKIAP
jgi:hypothetical protein